MAIDGTKISALPAAATLDGTEETVLVQAGANVRATTQDIADLAGGGGGSFNSYAAKVPDSSQWTQFNFTGAAASEASVAGGLTQALNLTSGTLSGGTRAVQGLSRPAPTAPYRVVAAIRPATPINQGGAYGISGVGWSDGTKLQVLSIFSNSGANAYFEIDNFASPTGSTSAVVTSQISLGLPLHAEVWIGLYDDGTNIHIQTSSDSVHWVDYYTVSKASGYLGASGYSNIVFYVDTLGTTGPHVSSTLLCWDEDGLNRTLTSVYG
jgi:hypothetical protein